MAGVKDPSDARGLGHIDGCSMLAHRLLAAGIGRHNENLCSALEGVGQARGVLEIPLADANAPCHEFLRLFGVTNADSHPCCRNSFQQLLYYCSAEVTVST